jgi:transposase-like protein
VYQRFYVEFAVFWYKLVSKSASTNTKTWRQKHSGGIHINPRNYTLFATTAFLSVIGIPVSNDVKFSLHTLSLCRPKFQHKTQHSIIIVRAHCNKIYIATDRRSPTVSQLNERLRKQCNPVCQSCEQTFQTKSCETARAEPRPVCDPTQPSLVHTVLVLVTRNNSGDTSLAYPFLLHRFDLGPSQCFPSDP